MPRQRRVPEDFHVRSSRVDTFTLVTLGRLTLLSPSGEVSESLAKRRLKLALLAVLATSRRPISRATLVEMFWGDQDEARARHSLSDALSHLRRELGRAAITTRDADVSLAPDAPIAVDSVMFVEAVEAQSFARAAELYAGGFLEGVDIEAAASFDHWVTRERRRLETMFCDVCARQCLAHARAREWEQCASLSARWLDAAPLSADAALFRLNALKAPGTREASQRALAEFDALATRLAREFDLPPDRAVSELARTIRAQLDELPPPAPVSADDASSPVAASVVPDGASPPAADPAVPPRQPVTFESPSRWRLRVTRTISAGVALVALLGAVAATTRTTAPVASSRPRVAIAIDAPSSDSAVAWLTDGLPQMIVSELARSPDVEVVPTGQVSALLRRRGAAPKPNDGSDDILDLGHRLGATLVVSGTIARDNGAIVLDLTVRDATTGKLIRTDALSRPDAVSLADEAAARVLIAVNAERPGLHIADIETSSVEAYQHFIRATTSDQEGRTQDAVRELDAAIALDSGFVTAVHARLDYATAGYEDDIADRLRSVLRRNDARATDFDRLRSSTYEALYAGEAERGEAIARQLVRRYPRDPRAYGVLASVLSSRGRFDATESVWRASLALDSLTMEAGSGPCAPCGMYGALARTQMQEGKWADAERSTRRWAQLQPDAPGAWATLAALFAYQQRGDEAIAAARRAVSLSGSDPGLLDLLGRILLMSRRYAAVDSLIAAWLASPQSVMRSSALDLRELLLRERGQFRAADSAIAPIWADLPNGTGSAPDLMHGNNLGRIGNYAGAALTYERVTHGPPGSPAVFPPRGTATRGYCWHHALLADAIAPGGDTARLAAIADTLRVGCASSFFGRDRVLYHHVRGLLAMRRGHWLEAVFELQQARWGVSEAWTRTNVALANAQMRLGEPRGALATLREAYAAPLDGMGRYQPRSELDYLMSRAFRQVGEADSAEIYEGYARTAWRDADPEVKRVFEVSLAAK